MDQLVVWHREHTKNRVSPEVEAAWLHHRFVQIHPFQDGNGRVARTLATLVFLRAGWFPLVLTQANRKEYIAALEAADSGDLMCLVELFSKTATQTFGQAVDCTNEGSFFSVDVDRLTIIRPKCPLLTIESFEMFQLTQELLKITSDEMTKMIKSLSEALFAKGFQGISLLYDQGNYIVDSHFDHIFSIPQNCDYRPDHNDQKVTQRIIIENQILSTKLSINTIFHALDKYPGQHAVWWFTSVMDGPDDKLNHLLSDKPFLILPVFDHQKVIDMYKQWLSYILALGINKCLSPETLEKSKVAGATF
jgi:hypothetical protein